MDPFEREQQIQANYERYLERQRQAGKDNSEGSRKARQGYNRSVARENEWRREVTGRGGGGAPESGGCVIAIMIVMALPTVGAVATYYS